MDIVCQDKLKGELCSPSSPCYRSPALGFRGHSSRGHRQQHPPVPKFSAGASSVGSFSQSLPQPNPMSFASSPTSFPKSYQINWQKQLQALSQLPNTPGSFSLPSTTQNALGKTFPVAPVSLQPQINRFAPRA